MSFEFTEQSTPKLTVIALVYFVTMASYFVNFQCLLAARFMITLTATKYFTVMIESRVDVQALLCCGFEITLTVLFLCDDSWFFLLKKNNHIVCKEFCCDPFLHNIPFLFSYNPFQNNPFALGSYSFV